MPRCLLPFNFLLLFIVASNMSLWKSLNRLSFYAINLNIMKQSCKQNLEIRLAAHIPNSFRVRASGIYTSCIRQDLMEFFDDTKNWSEVEVLVGRSWRKDELRIKSNSDLHKLWYVLLKERNMLLTMQHEYERKFKPFPNPERLDKVEESMENLETVVRERNRAYFELETGDTGERPIGTATNCFGLKYQYRMKEHYIEKKYNKKFLAEEKLRNHTSDHKYVSDFLSRLEEKKRRIKNYSRRKQFELACKLLRTFPNLDEEALKLKFPDLDIEDVKKDKRSRAHQENMY